MEKMMLRISGHSSRNLGLRNFKSPCKHRKKQWCFSFTVEICLNLGSRAGCTWKYIEENRSEEMERLNLNFRSSETLRYMITLGENCWPGTNNYFDLCNVASFLPNIMGILKIYNLFFSEQWIILKGSNRHLQINNPCSYRGLQLSWNTIWVGTLQLSWDHHTAGKNRSRRLLKYLDDNFVVQLLGQLNRKDASLICCLPTGRIFSAKWSLVAILATVTKIIAFKISVGRRRSVSKTLILAMKTKSWNPKPLKFYITFDCAK